MKKALFGILIILIGCAPATLQERQTSDVIVFTGMTKDQIFDKSVEWIHTSFGSGKAVMEYQDKAQGKIIGNVNTSANIALTDAYFSSNMTIEIKDGKARLQLTARSITFPGSSPRDIYGSDEIDRMRNSHQSLKDSYTAYMKSSSAKQDW